MINQYNYIAAPRGAPGGMSQKMRNCSTETTNIKPSRLPKLSMVWVKEFDGEKYRLVARWVVDN